MSNERIERIRADLSTRDKWTLEDYRDFYQRDVVETLLPELDRRQAELDRMYEAMDALRREYELAKQVLQSKVESLQHQVDTARHTIAQVNVETEPYTLVGRLVMDLYDWRKTRSKGESFSDWKDRQ